MCWPVRYRTAQSSFFIFKKNGGGVPPASRARAYRRFKDFKTFKSFREAQRLVNRAIAAIMA
jgi:hypothetical protein